MLANVVPECQSSCASVAGRARNDIIIDNIKLTRPIIAREPTSNLSREPRGNKIFMLLYLYCFTPPYA